MVTLSDLYDADQRTRNPQVRGLAVVVRIPHPLRGVQYADGIERCTHARKHQPEWTCPTPALPADQPPSGHNQEETT